MDATCHIACLVPQTQAVWTQCEVWTRMAAPLRESERVWQFWFGSAAVSDLFRTRWFPAEGKKEQQAAADAEVNAQFADTLAAAVAGEPHTLQRPHVSLGSSSAVDTALRHHLAPLSLHNAYVLQATWTTGEARPRRVSVLSSSLTSSRATFTATQLRAETRSSLLMHKPSLRASTCSATGSGCQGCLYRSLCSQPSR